jgi:predicted RNA-binding Zn-ribbon protein involved in translation (DUF1610 family)
MIANQNKTENSARVFARIKQNGNFFNLFKCLCGNTEWLIETNEFTRKFTCNKCGENYTLVKKTNRHYNIAEQKRIF